jgi:phage terminase large subunit
VWEGHCRQTLDGAIYAREIREATEAGRLMARIPYEPSKPVVTAWDLGRADKTCIWFVQQVGFEYRVIDYLEGWGEALPFYLKKLQAKAYVYGDNWLPHDAENELLASERTIAQQMRAAGFTVRIAPKIGVTDGINAARTFFPSCWFDADKCADGLNALRRYRYDIDPQTGQRDAKPLHDDASHAADAFRYLAVSMRGPAKPKLVFDVLRARPGGASAWMTG